MVEKIKARIEEYRSKIDDNIMRCRVRELEWVLSLMQEEEQKQDDVMKYLKKFTDKEYRRIGLECSKSGIEVEKIAEFVRYRIQIKKPVKTTRPVTAFIKKLAEAKAQGFDIDKVMEIMMDSEWQTFELEWIREKIPKKMVGSGLKEFGFN